MMEGWYLTTGKIMVLVPALLADLLESAGFREQHGEDTRRGTKKKPMSHIDHFLVQPVCFHGGGFGS